MSKIADLIQTEPVAAQAVVQSALALGMAFGLGMTPAQMAAALVFTASLLAFFTRKAVTPVAK